MLQQRVGPESGAVGGGRLWQRQRGRSDDGDGCRRCFCGAQAVPKEVARLFPDHLLLSLREVRALARPPRDFGALARPWRRRFSCDFCNCVRARWRWVFLGRGGRGTSTAAAAHVTGCIPVGFGWNPGRAGEGTGFGAEETVVRSALAARRGRDDCSKALPSHPTPRSRTAAPPGGGGGAPLRTLLSGCASCW